MNELRKFLAMYILVQLAVSSILFFVATSASASLILSATLGIFIINVVTVLVIISGEFIITKYEDWKYNE